MLGLSAQDTNIQEIFVKAQVQLPAISAAPCAKQRVIGHPNRVVAVPGHSGLDGPVACVGAQSAGPPMRLVSGLERRDKTPVAVLFSVVTTTQGGQRS